MSLTPNLFYTEFILYQIILYTELFYTELILCQTFYTVLFILNLFYTEVFYTELFYTELFSTELILYRTGRGRGDWGGALEGLVVIASWKGEMGLGWRAGGVGGHLRI